MEDTKNFVCSYSPETQMVTINSSLTKRKERFGKVQNEEKMPLFESSEPEPADLSKSDIRDKYNDAYTGEQSKKSVDIEDQDGKISTGDKCQRDSSSRILSPNVQSKTLRKQRPLVEIPMSVISDMAIETRKDFCEIYSCDKNILASLQECPNESSNVIIIKDEPNSLPTDDDKSVVKEEHNLADSAGKNDSKLETKCKPNSNSTKAGTTDELQLLNSVLTKMEKAGDELQRDPEFLSCLLQEVKIKLCQERLTKERPVQMIGLGDHTYMVPRLPKKSSKDQRPSYECRVCKKKFPAQRRQRYISHLKIHSGERPYKCSICTRGFNRKDHLTVHMRLHTGEKPFKCELCETRFTHKASLSNHKCDKRQTTCTTFL